jgi:hypothetical protein
VCAHFGRSLLAATKTQDRAGKIKAGGANGPRALLERISKNGKCVDAVGKCFTSQCLPKPFPPNRSPPHLVGHRADAGGIPGQCALLQWVCLHTLIISAGGKMFASYATFSSGARCGPRACRGIVKKHCRAFEALDLSRISRLLSVFGGAFFGKPQFEVFSRFWRWMLS